MLQWMQFVAFTTHDPTHEWLVVSRLIGHLTLLKYIEFSIAYQWIVHCISINTHYYVTRNSPQLLGRERVSEKKRPHTINFIAYSFMHLSNIVRPCLLLKISFSRVISELLFEHVCVWKKTHHACIALLMMKQCVKGNKICCALKNDEYYGIRMIARKCRKSSPTTQKRSMISNDILIQPDFAAKRGNFSPVSCTPLTVYGNLQHWGWTSARIRKTTVSRYK